MASNGNGVGMAEQCKMVHPDGTVFFIDARVFKAYREFVEQRKQGSMEVAFLSGGVRQVTSTIIHRE